MTKKLIIDLLLFISTILLMNYAFTGNLLHELLGIVMFAFATYHKYKNSKWLKSVFNQIKSKKFNFKLILNYIIDYILWILLLLITVTGILMSKSLFTFITVNINNLYQIHTLVAKLFMGTVIVHTLLHIKLISTFVETKFKIKNKKSIKFILLFLIVALSLLGFKETIDKYIYSHKNNLKEKDEINVVESDKASDEEENKIEDPTIPTLYEYLSAHNCTNCSNRCPLSAISCAKGEAPKQVATEEYYRLYN